MEKLTSINIKSIVAKINELIAYTLDSSKKYDDSKLVKRVKALEDAPKYVYDDGRLKERIKKLECAPKHTYDDSELINRVKALEGKPEPKQKEFDDSAIMLAIGEISESIASLDKRIDFVRRTYSEKWEKAEFERTKFQREIGEQIAKIETPQEIDLSGIERRIDKLELVEHVDLSGVENRISKLESVEHNEYDDSEIKASISEVRKLIPQPYNDSAIIKSISDIKKAIPQPVSLVGIESRLKKLEEKSNYFYNDKPVLKQIDIIKSELSDVKESLNEILE